MPRRPVRIAFDLDAPPAESVVLAEIVFAVVFLGLVATFALAWLLALAEEFGIP